jgi:DNA-directed RNA polymerase subunit M/transcription elongation factor TFIIS
MASAAGFPCPFCGHEQATVEFLSTTAEDGADMRLRCQACDYVWRERP